MMVLRVWEGLAVDAMDRSVDILVLIRKNKNASVSEYKSKKGTSNQQAPANNLKSDTIRSN